MLISDLEKKKMLDNLSRTEGYGHTVIPGLGIDLTTPPSVPATEPDPQQVMPEEILTPTPTSLYQGKVELGPTTTPTPTFTSSSAYGSDHAKLINQMSIDELKAKGSALSELERMTLQEFMKEQKALTESNR